jgi:hypothetical protein
MNETREESMAGFYTRMLRAAKLDVGLYEEVEHDSAAMGQAMGAVILSSVAAGIGHYSVGGVSGLVSGTAGAIIGWFVWAYVTYLIGTKLLPEPQTLSTHGELLRTIGFSSSPGILRVFGIIPGLYPAVFMITGVWMLVSMIVAVRQALDYRSTFRAVVVVFIGWVIYIIVFGLLWWIFNTGAPINAVFLGVLSTAG